MIITTPPLRDRLPGADTRFVPGREVRGRDGLYGGPCGISDMMGANPGTYEKSLGEAVVSGDHALPEAARPYPPRCGAYHGGRADCEDGGTGPRA